MKECTIITDFNTLRTYRYDRLSVKTNLPVHVNILVFH